MKHQEKLSIISHASASIVSSLYVSRMLDSLVEELKKVVDISWSAIVQIEGKTVHFLALTSDNGSALKPGDQMPLKGSAYEWVVTHRTVMVEPELLKGSRSNTDKDHIKQGIQSLACFPLIREGKVTGVITMASRQPHAFGPQITGVLERLTPLIAAQVKNTHLYSEAVEMARIDELTGLYNRRALNEMITNETKRCSRYGGLFSLIILDIDTLKSINDTYGHMTGDEYLQHVGSIIKATIRDTDQAFRHGGDEFAILLTQTAINEATRVAERVRQQVASNSRGLGIPITCSLGVASWPASGPGVNELLNAADSALYQAKQDGRNRSNTNAVAGPKGIQDNQGPSGAQPQTQFSRLYLSRR